MQCRAAQRHWSRRGASSPSDILPRPPIIRTLGLPSVPAAGAVAAGSAGGALSLMADEWQQRLEYQHQTSATGEGVVKDNNEGDIQR